LKEGKGAWLGTATNAYTPALGSHLLIGQSPLNSSAIFPQGLSGTRQCTEAVAAS